MNSLLKKIKLLSSIIVYLWDPKNVNSVLKMGNSLSRLYDNDLTIENLKKTDSRIKEIIESKFGVQKFDFQKLEHLPKGSLGKTFANYVKVNNLNPNYYNNHTKAVELSDYNYLVFRMRQTHDIWHLITGFDTSEAGEAGLITFYYAQLRTPLSRLIIALSFVHFSIRFPVKIPKLLDLSLIHI